MEVMQLEFGEVSLEAHRYARSGPVVCLLPGLGGGIRRYAGLGQRLASVGLQPVALNPRGAGSSTGPLDELRMTDLAADVAGVIERLGAPAIVVGNAFGNRVARFLATDRPELVAAVVLICAGGEVPPEPEAADALAEFFDESLSTDERLDAARRSLFASGNEVDASFIDPGRTAVAARSQRAAMRAEGTDHWLAGGSARMLVIQGGLDRIARPENGHRLRDRWPDRVEVVDIAQAGHAVLNERTDAVAHAIVDFVGSIEGFDLTSDPIDEDDR